LFVCSVSLTPIPPDDADQYATIQSVFSNLATSVPLLGSAYHVDFLSPTDDGNGHWKTGIFTDAGHPNTAGNELMFDSLNATFYENVDMSALEAQTSGPTVPCTTAPAVATQAPLSQDPSAAPTASAASHLGLGAVSSVVLVAFALIM
jgi:hypothetical protein